MKLLIIQNLENCEMGKSLQVHVTLMHSYEFRIHESGKHVHKPKGVATFICVCLSAKVH